MLQLLLQAHHVDLVQSLVVLTSGGEPITLQHGAGACDGKPPAACMSGLMLTDGTQQQQKVED